MIDDDLATDDGIPSGGCDLSFAINLIMSTKDSRAFMMMVLNKTNVFTDRFDRDPCINSYLCGMRSVGLDLQANMMKTTPESYNKMIKEHLIDG